jgi:acyl-CoA thioesterase YciA
MSAHRRARPPAPGESASSPVVDSVPAEGEPAIRVVMMPRDTNAWGTIFGGIILSYIDQAGAVEAHRRGCRRVVTVAMNQVEFHHPVFVGDLVSFYAALLRVGRSSVHVRVTVQAERRVGRDERVLVTQADVVYVNVDDSGRPIQVPGVTALSESRPRRSRAR